MPLVPAVGRSIAKKEPMRSRLTSDYPNFGYVHYVTIVVSIAQLRYIFLTNWPRYQQQFKLDLEYEEYLYDWIVNEALTKTLGIMFQSKVEAHYKHDIYKCVYDEIGYHAEQVIIQQVKNNKLQFSKGQSVKTLVAGDILTIVKGVVPSV